MFDIINKNQYAQITGFFSNLLKHLFLFSEPYCQNLVTYNMNINQKYF